MFIIVGNIHSLIQFASFLIWVTYGACMTALLVLRKTQPDIPRPYRVPTIVPIFILLISLFLSLMPIISAPSVKYLAALGFIAIGVILYTPFVYYKKRPRIMSNSLKFSCYLTTNFIYSMLLDKVTYLLQMLFNVAPTTPHYVQVPVEEK